MNDLYFTIKPAGVNTHAADKGKPGFVEWLNQGLFVCQRLDKDTSGAMVFAKTKAAAAQLTKKFANREIYKEYYLVSTKKSPEKSWERNDSNGHTQFEYLKSHNNFHLYKALPKSGKTHQIRKHAMAAKIPILGDRQYGGAPFCRLMLHCHKVMDFTAPLPLVFSDLELCENLDLASWLCAFERRKLLFPKKLENGEGLRLVHSDSHNLRVDLVGDVLWMGWWQDSEPTSKQQDSIRRFAEILGYKKWLLQWRRSDGFEKIQGSEVPETWEFYENQIKFIAKIKSGHSFGLFFDQRDNRQKLKALSQGQKVLNLFSYTCGFSVAAALGGAEKVVSVDTHKSYLEWGRENFHVNDLNTDSDQYEFRAMDSMDYLKYAAKKGLQFDCIVCDPPSFSRQGKKVFRVDKDFLKLMEACETVLAPGGCLQFSTNWEKWSLDGWKTALLGALRGSDLKLEGLGDSGWDFEIDKNQALLKTFFFAKA